VEWIENVLHDRWHQSHQGARYKVQGTTGQLSVISNQ
jgi:hypothetical protein